MERCIDSEIVMTIDDSKKRYILQVWWTEVREEVGHVTRNIVFLSIASLNRPSLSPHSFRSWSVVLSVRLSFKLLSWSASILGPLELFVILHAQKKVWKA